MTLPVDKLQNESQLKSIIALQQTVKITSFISYMHPKGIPDSFRLEDYKWEKDEGEETGQTFDITSFYF